MSRFLERANYDEAKTGNKDIRERVHCAAICTVISTAISTVLYWLCKQALFRL